MPGPKIFVPGPGWIAFDPTNGTVGGDDLIRVAVARDIYQIVPIAGSFHGAAEDYLGMEVDVIVRPVARDATLLTSLSFHQDNFEGRP